MPILCPACDHPIAIHAGRGNGDTSEILRSISNVVCPNCGLVHVPSSLDPTTLDTRVGQPPPEEQIAHFRLLQPLGHGSFGTVWLARDTVLGRNIALKVPVPRENETSALLHEAQAAATLKHPNIVSIFEVGEIDGQVFIASEYIDGPTLQDVLANGVPERTKSINWLIAISRALHHAHEQGIVHRDVKPGNILINSEGQPYVTDFGLAKRISSNETISSEGHVMGTARYMSPEQASGWTRATDQRSDIYAIGVILFEMLTGFTPFRGNIRAILLQKTVEDAPSPRKLSPNIPRDLETICLKCLERDPGRRYQTASEVADELQRFQQGEPIRARPISSLARGWRWCLRRPTIAGLVAALFLSLSIGLASVTYFFQEAQQNARQALESLYRSRMNLAAEQLKKGDYLGLKRMLDSVAANPQMADLRGFEWYHAQSVLEPYVQVVNLGQFVQDVAVSPDGTFFAACANDRQVQVWSAETGARVATIAIDVGRFRSIDFSPTDGLLATGASDGRVRLWDVQSPATPIRVVKHGPPVALIRFSPDGSKLAALGSRGAARIFRSKDFEKIVEIPTGMAGAQDIRFTPDGEALVVVAAEGLMRIWDIATRQQIVTRQGQGLISALAVSDDGEAVVTGSYGGNVTFWRDESVEPTTFEADWRIGDLEFLKDSSLLAILENNGQLRIYDTKQQLEIRKLTTHGLSSGALARSADGRFLVVGSGDGSVKLMRAESVSRPDTFWHRSEIRALEFLPGGRELVAGSGNGELRLWDLKAGVSTPLIAAGGEASSSAISTLSVQPGGRLLAVAGRGSSLTLFDYKSRQPVLQLDVKETGIARVQFSPDGGLLAVATRGGPLLIYAEQNWEQPVCSISDPGYIFTAVAFSPDSRQLAVSGDDGKVRLVDSLSGGQTELPLQLDSVPYSLTYDRTGEFLIVGTDTGEIRLWNLAAGELRHVLSGHAGRVNALAVMPYGATLVSGGRDHSLRLWDLVSGEQVTSLYGHDRQVFEIAVSPDGKMIASGGLEGDIRLWRGGPNL
ncbi:Serine/threonine-protein kinase PrkC [Maioricimonas rarisocia]|uniref:non-specific serine/threonine protein kinase n=1 Tax=Maioricimonas rarisocia TaxID=2528026 RepID=A0A517ZFG0_9PLAN|nr:protein kinase [Maioricimonas rarisocia]QDU41201.1 Serine/threonine-protein kinase PrkC [Maioricimonas rarisocia]